MVSRGLAAFGTVTLILIGLTEACAGQPSPSTSQAQAAADAQATNVRRTAVADAQRIIANNPIATPTVTATAIPRPNCLNAIWWHEARSHVGEMRTVEGTIVGTRGAADGSTLLELGQPYPDPTGVAILIRPPAVAPDVIGKTVCVAGRIVGAEGRPTMLVRDQSSIVVVN
jgi:hypothetical protein